MTQFTAEFCSENKMLVLDKTDDLIKIGVSESKPDEVLRSRIENILTGSGSTPKVQFISMREPELMLAISALESVASNNGTEKKEYEISTIEKGAPAITVLNSILLDAKSRGASDVHLEKDREGVRVRLRIDGVLHTFHRFDSMMGNSLAVRIKLMANLNTLETRKPQDGRFSITAGGADHDIRVSIVSSVNGESTVLRFLDTGNTDITLEGLGFSPFIFRRLSSLSARPQGLILVTGPTGSGKTTTLASLIRRCDTEKRKVISIEDPVEYRIPGIIQIQTNENLGLGFSVLLKRILRQDPDVLMIGEIRDGETAELSVRAALTGALVLATLHTRSAREAETRLLDMGVPSYLLDTVLYAVLNQRLVRRTCAACRGAGCERCAHSGYSGRQPVAEMHIPGMKDAALSGRTLQMEGLSLIKEGLTDKTEIERVLGESA